ncbi:MAG TPA: hypothetical protein VGB63_18425 [Pedobacter sp.]|jgi:hypothetical protein
MTLSFPNSASVKQFLPGLYFIAVAIWLAFDHQNLWLSLVVPVFIIQMILNNRYLNLVLGFLMIIWSAYIALTNLISLNSTPQLIIATVCFVIANLYMSRLLFLNQNFKIAAFRENSLDDTLFI